MVVYSFDILPYVRSFRTLPSNSINYFVSYWMQRKRINLLGHDLLNHKKKPITEVTDFFGRTLRSLRVLVGLAPNDPDWARTSDLHPVKVALSQLSYKIVFLGQILLYRCRLNSQCPRIVLFELL